MDSDPYSFVIILVTLVLSAFFSGLEIAFISANKLRIELKSNQGHHWAKLLAVYTKRPSKFISTILVGNNVALVIYGTAMEELLRPKFEALGGFSSLLIATIISTAIVLVTAEFLPKSLFRLNPSGILAALIYPFQFFYYILWVPVQVVISLSKWLLKLILKKEFTEESPVFNRMDLDHFISQTNQGDDDSDSDLDTDILKNALEFGSVLVRDCLVPRTQIDAIEVNEPIDALFNLFETTRHSKILVYRENIDQIIGYVHHFDLYKSPKNISSILMPILVTTESKPANDLLKEFTKTRKSIALVVDEFGGTSGIVSVEDIMEEIFGEIEDEHDDDTNIIEEKISDLKYKFSAGLEVDYLNEKYNLHLPEGDYETLGGLVISHHENIPEQDEEVRIEGFIFEILEAEEQRIQLVSLKITED